MGRRKVSGKQDSAKGHISRWLSMQGSGYCWVWQGQRLCVGAWQQVRLGTQAGTRSSRSLCFNQSLWCLQRSTCPVAVLRVTPGRAPPVCDVEGGFKEAGLEAWEAIPVREEDWVCPKGRGEDRCESRWQHVLSPF